MQDNLQGFDNFLFIQPDDEILHSISGHKIISSREYQIISIHRLLSD